MCLSTSANMFLSACSSLDKFASRIAKRYLESCLIIVKATRGVRKSWQNVSNCWRTRNNTNMLSKFGQVLAAKAQYKPCPSLSNALASATDKCCPSPPASSTRGSHCHRVDTQKTSLGSAAICRAFCVFTMSLALGTCRAANSSISCVIRATYFTKANSMRIQF